MLLFFPYKLAQAAVQGQKHAAYGQCYGKQGELPSQPTVQTYASVGEHPGNGHHLKSHTAVFQILVCRVVDFLPGCFHVITSPVRGKVGHSTCCSGRNTWLPARW